MNECAFCYIMAGKAKASYVYQDELCIAIMDIQPVNPGHVLVIPIEHHPLISEYPNKTILHLFDVSVRIVNAIRNSGVRCDGINMFLADGEAAGQDIFHTHLHIFPRYQGDSFKIAADWQKAERQQLDEIASKIKLAYLHA